MYNLSLSIIGIYSSDNVVEIINDYVDHSDRLYYLRKGLIPSTDSIFWNEFYKTIQKPIGKMLYENVVQTSWQLSYPISINIIINKWLVDTYGNLASYISPGKWKKIKIPDKILGISSSKKGVFVLTEHDNVWYVTNSHTVFDGYKLNHNIIEIKTESDEICYILTREGTIYKYSPFSKDDADAIDFNEKIYGLLKINDTIIFLPESAPDFYYIILNNKIIKQKKLENIIQGNTSKYYSITPLLISGLKIKIHEKILDSSTDKYQNEIDINNYMNIYRDIEMHDDIQSEYEQHLVDNLRMAEDVGDALLAYNDEGNYPIF